MEINVYNRDMEAIGVIDEITSLIWTRRYWSKGEFKLLVPFTERHVQWLVKYNIIMRRGDDEAAEIREVQITTNGEGMEEIEVQGIFLSRWIGKRIIETQIVTKDTSQNILYRIVTENAIRPTNPARVIPNITLNPDDSDTESGIIDYTSEANVNALLEAETVAKAAKIGFKVITDARARKHYFSVYEGRNLTADQTVNKPCIFSKEFDNIEEQSYGNSVENLRSTAYVGGEDTKPRTVIVVGGGAAGLDRDELFVNASDIQRTYTDANGNQIARTESEYLSALEARGASELQQHGESLEFGSSINTHANLKYRVDYDLGDRVTCVNKKWRVKINVRITEISEIYEATGQEINITFGESLPTLLDAIRQTIKAG